MSDERHARLAVPFNDFAARCGFFNADARTNNGYGCAHHAQESRSDWAAGSRNPQDAEGHCLPFSCPFGYEMEPDSEEDRTLMLAAGYDPAFGEGDYLGLWDEGMIARMRLEPEPNRATASPRGTMPARTPHTSR